MRGWLRWLTQWLSDPQRGFAPANPQESIVFGARRPGFPSSRVSSTLVDRWIVFMVTQDIQRVVCLLPTSQLRGYSDLLERYQHVWGEQNVLWAPIADFHLADERQLVDQILPFLAVSARRQQKTVVHCSAGQGRTGHVIAAWLVSYRQMSNEEALRAVHHQGRNARESHESSLDRLLDRYREADFLQWYRPSS